MLGSRHSAFHILPILKTMFWIIPVILFSGFVASGPIMSDVEQARYDVINHDGDYEVRQYAPHIVAETIVAGERKEAIGQGFKKIADFIFGNNRTSQKVAMTAPVMQESGQTIAMTAPVSQELANISSTGTSWKVRFVMPADFTLATLPQPNNPDIKLMEVVGKKVVAVQFSGTADDELLQQEEADLRRYMDSKGMKAMGSPIYAFYNPPWTLPFLRRNEVMLETDDSAMPTHPAPYLPSVDH